MNALTLTGTDLFIGWLAEEDEPLYALFRRAVSVETYDNQQSCLLHLFTENTTFTAEQQMALQHRWLEYCEIFDLPVNPDSLQDLSGWSLKKIFDTYSGKFVKFILIDGVSFFGRLQYLHYTHSPHDPTPPTRTSFLEVIKYPNFYTDQNALSSHTESIVVAQDQIKHIVPVSR